MTPNVPIRDNSEKAIHKNLSRHLGAQVNRQLSQSLPFVSIFAIFLFAGLLYFTPIYRHYPLVIWTFAGSLSFVHLIQFLFVSSSFSFSAKKSTAKWEILFWLSTGANSFLWGGFTGWIMYQYALSWTSFLQTLIACTLALAYMPILVPRLRVLSLALMGIVGSASLSCFVFLSGQQGSALGLFFAAYLFLLLKIGKKQNWNYWETLRTSNKIAAMVDSIPGSIFWMDNTKKIISGNKKFYELFQKKELEEMPEKMGELVDSIFQGKAPAAQVKVGRKLNLMTGTLYNHGAEAVVIGLDISGQEVFEDELERDREFLLKNIKAFELGEVSNIFFKVYPDPSPAHVKNFLSLFSKGTKDRTIESLCQFMVQMFSELHPGVRFETYGESHHKIHRDNQGKFLLTLFQVLKNGVESALLNQKEKVVWLEIKEDPTASDFPLILFGDSGLPVDNAYDEVVFEHFVSTKKQHLGMGLWLAREHLGDFGELELAEGKASHKFQLSILQCADRCKVA